MGTRYGEGGNHLVTKSYHYSQAKRETGCTSSFHSGTVSLEL